MHSQRTIAKCSATAFALSILLAPLVPSVTANAVDRPASSRVIGGTPVDQSRTPTPWFVQLNPVIDGADYLCGGTAISDRWILTAAHCVTVDRRTASLAASSARRNPASLDAGPVLRWSSVTVHPKYDPSSDDYDVALIRTASPMNTVGLPYNASATTPILGTGLQVFGFGGTSSAAISSALQVGNIVDLVGPAGQCGKYGNLYRPKTMLCAGLTNAAADSCQGDSGGPLTTTGATPTLVGVVSWGNGCALAKYPGVYARVSAFASWIQSVSGVHPKAGPAAAAKVRALKPCSQVFCTLKQGERIEFPVRNTGNAPGNWSTTGVGVNLSPKNGSLAQGSASTVAVRARTARTACVTISVRSAGRLVLTFKIGLNGAKCR
jgi:secreted trypsin-like serine protease